MKKKLLSILLIAVSVICAFTLCVSAATTISTADALIDLMNDSTAWSADYVLGGDIDLSTYMGVKPQAPIGNGSTYFTGNFDGAGHTISGLNIVEENNTVGRGLFGAIKNGSVKKLTVSGAVTSNGDRTGGIVGYMFGTSTIEDCTSYVTVTLTEKIGAGGIVGTILESSAKDVLTVKNCANYGVVKAVKYSGGIVGTIASSSSANSNYTIVIEDCVNFAKVTNTGGACAGGILGFHTLSTTKGTNTVTIRNCANYGAISVGSSQSYAGGIVGATGGNSNYSALFTFTITNCYNAGTITGKVSGGIAGLLRPESGSGGGAYHFTNCVSADSSNKPIIGGFGTGKSATEPAVFGGFENLYSVGATEVYDHSATMKNFAVDETKCYTANSTAEELAALAAMDGFTDVFGTPALADYAEISTAEELVYLSAHPELWSSNYKLTADIDLSTLEGVTQAPIGNKTTSFTGKFDGNNKTVSGVNIVNNVSTSSAQGMGFFGCVKNCTIKNLTVVGSVSSKSSRGGGLVGVASGDVVIENCVSDIEVEVSSGASAGIVGTFAIATGSDLTIINCRNEGNITGSAYNGGILGYIVNSTADYTVLIKDCVNNGTITSKSTSSNHAGGILGYSAASATSGTNSVTISGCENHGNVSTAAKYAGGIVGGMGGAKDATYAFTFTMTDCYNDGNVSGTNSGSIAGILHTALAEDAYTIENIMANDSVANPVFGQLAASTYTLTNVYSATATDMVGVDTEYTLEGTYYTSDASAEELATLASKDLWMGDATYGVELKSAHKHAPIYVADGGNGHTSFCLCRDEQYNTALEPHNVVDGLCSTCGFTCEHTETTEVVTTPATCVTPGIKSNVCVICNTVVSEAGAVDVDANNHEKNGVTLSYDSTANTLSYVRECCNAFVVEDTTLEATVYVAKNGADLANGVSGVVGYTAENAFKNLEDAITVAAAVANIKGVDVTVQIVDEAAFTTASFATPAYNTMLTITGGKIAANADVTRFFQHGKVTVRNVEFDNKAAIIWSARGNKVVMDTGITHTSGAANLYVIGGFQSNTLTKFNPDVTVRSGDWYVVASGNRQQGSKGCTTNGTVTIGTVNEEDTLVIDNFYSFHLGGGEISADSTVTVIVDGAVNIKSKFYANIQTTSATVGDEYTYTVNYVIKGAGDVTSDIALTNNAPQSTIIYNVYADERSEAAKADAARIVATDNITVNNYTYEQYCSTVLNHNGATSGTCAECGAEIVDANACKHESTELQTVTPSTCTVKGTANVFCNDCLNVVGTAELEIDATNHAANKNFVWSQNAESGAYEIICSECEAAYASQSTTPTVYLSNFGTAVGDDANDGLSAEKPVKTLNEAVARLKDVDGTVSIVKGYSLKTNHTLPEWNGTITFTSSSFDTYGAATAGFNIETHDVKLTLGGKSVFDSILFKGTSKKGATYTVSGEEHTDTVDAYRATIAANWNDIDFGYIRVQQFATIYLIAGNSAITESDTEPKTTHITVDGVARSTRALPWFFERIYLGSSVGKGGIEVSNKTVTLEVENGVVNTQNTAKDRPAFLYTVYTMSTSSNNAYGTSTTNDCTSTVTLKGDSSVVAFRTGDRNVSYDMLTNTAGTVEYGPSAGKLDNLTVNFLDNSYIADVEADEALAVNNTLGTFHIKNAKNVTINVSTEAEGRTVKHIHTFNFYKYGTFKDEEAFVTINGGNHSFISSIDPCANYAATASGTRHYTVLRDFTNDCEGNYTDWVTDGDTQTRTCTVCERTETRETPNTLTLTAVAGKVENGKVSVDVYASAKALVGAIFTVDATDGLTLVSVNDNEEDSFMLEVAESLATPCKMMLVNLETENVKLDNALIATLEFEVDGALMGEEGSIALAIVEALDVDENALETVAIGTTVTHTCAYERTFVLPTADKDAHFVYSCVDCASSYEVAAVTAVYENEVIYGSSVILESDLGLQILATIPHKVTAASEIWLMVETTDANGKTAKSVVNPFMAFPSNLGENLFSYRFNAARVSAKNIVDDITFTLCFESDGVVYVAPAKATNIISYYKAAENANAPAAIMKALDAMMNYSAAAQEYFEYNVGTLATTLTGTEKIDYAADTSVKVNATTTYGEEGINTYTTKQIYAKLEDKVVMAIKYSGSLVEGLVFKGTYTDIKGNEKTFTIPATEVDGYVTVLVDAIAAKDLRQAFTGALYVGETQVSNSVTTCFEAYATQAINDIADAKLNAVCRAALAYSDAAAAYLITK